MNAEREANVLEPTTTIEARYEIERVLGQGSAGIVYRVRDRETGERLALKKLLRVDPRSVQLLKHEFRALADLHHPNLIKLYDLGRVQGAWFITMEYLRGNDLLGYVSQAPANQNAGIPPLARLCGAFAQLAHGIEALHRAGMLHRDLKPRNVMVDEERVVVLDFGLVREVGDTAATVTRDGTVSGTPAYMAPEQAQDSALSEATDWYAFGVMLYEALSGVLPFEGSVVEILRQKLMEVPTPLDQVASAVPAELSKLCMALLQREPQARPGYAAIIQVLEGIAPRLSFGTPLGPMSRHAPGRLPPTATLFGRDAELAVLEQAFNLTKPGKCVAVHVRGASGSGKSALVEHYLESLKLGATFERDDVLVLRARCHEREAMPFKALDGLLDTLTAFLERMDDLWVSHALPLHVADLARAFPVLERLGPARKLLSQAPPRGDAAFERANAERALRELLRRVASKQQVVLFVDDLQWGDLDSVRILKSWLEADEPLAFLLVLSYRSDELATNTCLQLLVANDQPRTAEELFIDLSPLPRSAIEAMCTAKGPLPAAWVERVGSEAHGSPLIATQLLVLAQARLQRGETDATALSIHDLLAQLTALLSPEARRLLNTLAIAGRPIEATLVLSAAELGHDGRSQLHALQGLGLTRSRSAGRKQLIEIYHDRVRAAVVAALAPDDRVALHRRLLSELMNRGPADPDWLHLLALGANDRQAAARYLRAAAERAAASLAFERAAELYRAYLRDESDDAAERGRLWRALGDNLAASGRGSQAADAYLQAAQLGAPASSEVTELKRLAATHLIRSGYFARGEQLVRDVLAALQIRVPETRFGLIAAIVWERLRAALRGLRFKPRQVPPERLYKVIAYSSLSIDTQAYDPVRATLFQARALRMALDLGDPRALTSALCLAATMRGVSGSARDERYADYVLDYASRLNEQLQDPMLQAHIWASRTMTSFLLGRVKETLPIAQEAERLHSSNASTRAETGGEYYHRFAVNAALIGVLFQFGQVREASVALHKALQHARATENRTAQLHLAMVSSVDDIAQGHPERARARLDADRPELPPGFGPLHLLHMVGVMRAGCALGDYAWTNAILAELWPRFQASMVKRSVLSLLAYGAHARVLLNQHVLSGSTGDPEALLRSDLRAMRRRSKRLSTATSTRYYARLAYIRGDLTEAARLFREHITACEEQGYNDEVQRGRFALGKILGGEEGQAQCDGAIQALSDYGFVQPLNDMPTHYPEMFVKV
ncbi:MAG TPA: protein kinase [Polyangiales bacterium]|nr:protein kinase [Polyangiales bacterium]